MIGGQQKKIGVVDAVKLFDQFDMKKELEAQEKLKLQSASKQMDSVGNLLQLAKAAKNEAEIKKLSYAYDYMKTALEQEYTAGNRDINAQVWKRLNPALDEFGKKTGMHLIIGANGMGTVLYNDDYFDLTAEAIKYINAKYENGN